MDTVFVVCLALAGALALCGWVLNADDRTDRLERLIWALQGRSAKPAKSAPKAIAPRPGEGQAEPWAECESGPDVR